MTGLVGPGSRRGCLVAALVLLLGLSACDRDAGAAKLIVVGSSTIAPVMAEIARRFETHHPGARVEVQAGGSSRGIADVRRGVADIGMVSRALTGDEAALRHWTIARDGVAMIAHRDNPVARLTGRQIVAIFTGEVRNWTEVGGADAPIVVVNKAEGRATLAVFVDYFGLDPRRIRPDVVIGDNQQGIKTVAGNRFAIGYVSIGAAEAAIEEGVPIRLLPLGRVVATTEAVARGEFPLSRPLNLVMRSEPDGLAADLLEFVYTEEAAALIRAQSFVPVRP